mgnify:CR=1 FL=1
MKKKEKKVCKCSPECECGCNEGKECTCEEENCKCCEGKECSCDECNCDDCECEECSCEDVVKEINELNKTVSELEGKLKEAEENILKEKAHTKYKEKEIEIEKEQLREIERIVMLKVVDQKWMDLVEEILPTLDNFERAIKLDDTNLTDELSKFLEGFKLIYCHLTNALEKYGVKAIDGNNKPFDPTYHNAVMVEKVEGVKPGMVVEVLQKGYMYKDKVLRTAMVKVNE